jgi:hypothetical protein
MYKYTSELRADELGIKLVMEKKKSRLLLLDLQITFQLGPVQIVNFFFVGGNLSYGNIN